MTIIDGKKISEEVKSEIKTVVDDLTAKGNRPPHLVAVLVGNDPASKAYVRNKGRASEKVGFTSSLLNFNEDISENELLKVIENLNNDHNVDGFIVQLPLPKHIDEQKIIFAISPAKDIDGFHPLNLGKMMINSLGFLSATPYGIIELIKRYKIQTEGKNVVIVGRSLIVGKPLSIMLSQNVNYGNATVTLAHSRTKNLKEITQKADIVIASIGKPNFITADMIKENAVVIDVGINSIDAPETKRGYKLVGDVDFENVSKKTSYITPVPGGVGPMTIAMLLQNTLMAYKNNNQLV
jgi:methylenetetrahydrofolate dehydrogenase (NADP+)/methenyltetrahydrofolate cyclohydrolase